MEVGKIFRIFQWKWFQTRDIETELALFCGWVPSTIESMMASISLLFIFRSHLSRSLAIILLAVYQRKFMTKRTIFAFSSSKLQMKWKTLTDCLCTWTQIILSLDIRSHFLRNLTFIRRTLYCNKESCSNTWSKWCFSDYLQSMCNRYDRLGETWLISLG